MAPPATDAPFTAFSSGFGPDTSIMNSIIASLNNPVVGSRTLGIVTTTTDTPPTPTTATSGAGTAVDTSLVTRTSSSSTNTAATSSRTGSVGVNTSTASRSSDSASTTGDGASGTSSAANAASTTNGSALTQQDTCNSISCSAGLKAAIAVPVVIGVLGLLALGFFIVRRRQRKERHEEQGIGKPKTKKKWTRHLRMFSFDAELLMGGRFSSTNSLRSDQASARGSTRSRPQEQQADHPSLHSVDEVAPPYRDAISHSQPPNMSQIGPGMMAAGAGAGAVGAAESHRRRGSNLTAPPPYVPAAQRTLTPTRQPASHANPFADSGLVASTDDSPFNDPHDTDGDSFASRLMQSRNSSLRHGVDGDDGSTSGGSEAASIHEAQVGRHVSVSSIGRTIQNFRQSNHST